MSTYELDDDLVRQFCNTRSHQWELGEALRPQIPARPIEEGCRVRRDVDDDGLSLVGTCGKPFHGRVLVLWDGDGSALSYALHSLVRVD